MLRFQIGRSSGGRLGVRGIPVYSLCDWQMDIAPDDTMPPVAQDVVATPRVVAAALGTVGSVVLELRAAVAGVAAAGAMIAGAGGDRQFAASYANRRDNCRSCFRPRNGGSLKRSNARSNRRVKQVSWRGWAAGWCALGNAAYWTATWGLIALAVVPLLLVPVHRVTVA